MSNNGRKTSEKRRLKQRKSGHLRGAIDGKPFTKGNQPSPLAKSVGWFRKRTLKQLIELPIRGRHKGALLVREFVAQYLGIRPEEIAEELTFEIAMDLRQIEKAIKGDTYAWLSIMNRVYGKPKEQIEHSSPILSVDLKRCTDEELEILQKAQQILIDSTGNA